MEEVDEGSGARPDSSSELAAISILEENTLSLPLVICDAIIDFDAGIDNGDVVVSRDDFSHAVEGKFGLIDSEIFIINHVVDVSPNRVEWQIVGLITIDHVLEEGNILIAPPTLVEAK